MHPTISGYLISARTGDAVRAGAQDRVLAQIRCARATVHAPARRAGFARRLARLTAAARTSMAATREQADTRINGF